MINVCALLINMSVLGKALEIMWKGVLSIAIVIALVLAVTTVVNKICVDKENKALEAEKQQENPEQ